jgi:hypothetical protein
MDQRNLTSGSSYMVHLGSNVVHLGNSSNISPRVNSHLLSMSLPFIVTCTSCGSCVPAALLTVSLSVLEILRSNYFPCFKTRGFTTTMDANFIAVHNHTMISVPQGSQHKRQLSTTHEGLDILRKHKNPNQNNKKRWDRHSEGGGYYCLNPS